MGIARLFRRGRGDSRPAPLSVAWAPGELLAPVDGRVVDLAALPDPAFSTGMMGPGMGVAPASGVLYAPADGRVSATTETRHAIALTTASGVEVLLHIGMDTVRLGGEGFVQYVAEGDRVRAGEPLVGFDRGLMAARGLDDTVAVVVTSAPAGVEPLATGAVTAGTPLLRVRPAAGGEAR